MYIARVLYPVKVLGPGDRIGIWFDGCVHRCKGCSNPELWEFQDKYKTSADTVRKLIDSVGVQYQVDGFTLTGGDPFLQPETLREILPILLEYSKDILCYTGYDYEIIKEQYPDIVEKIAVIIDGKYIEERNTNVFLRGSDNQRIIVRDDFKNKYNAYLENGTNEIQNFSTRDSVISVGIHKRSYEEDLEEIVAKNGLKKID